MCAVSSGLGCGLRLWCRGRTKLAAHRAGEGQDTDNSARSVPSPSPPNPSPQVWAWPVLHLVQEPHPQTPVFPRGQLCLIDFETATVKQLIKIP